MVKTGNKRLTIPPGKKAVLLDEAVTKVFTMTNGDPDKNLSDMIDGEKRAAVSKDREIRSGQTVGMKAEPKRPQNLYELAEESFSKAECYGDSADFMQQLTKVYYERHIRTVEYNLRDAVESGKRATEALNKLKAVKPGP